MTDAVGRFSNVLLVLVILALGAGLVWLVLRRRARRAMPAVDETRGE